MKRIFHFIAGRRVPLLSLALILLLFVYFVIKPQRRLALTPQERQAVARADAAERYDSEIAKLRERILKEPHNPRWRQELAAHYLRFRLWMDAAEVLEDAVQAGDTNVITLDALGDSYSHLGNREQAIHWFKQNIKLHPTEVGAYLRLSGLYTEMGETKWARQVLQHLPQSEIKSEMLTSIAAAYEKAGDYVQAGTLCAQRLQTAPQDVEAWWVLAQTRTRLGQWDKAAEALEKATQLDPNRAEFFYLLGTCRAQIAPNKELEQAVPLWAKAVTLNPSLSPAYYAMATALERAGHLPEAARAYVRAYEVPPQPVKALFDLARVYRLMGKTSLAHKAMGLYYKHKGDAKGAVREFEARLKLEPKNELAYIDLAEAYQDAARLEDAVQILKKALAQTQKPGAIYYSLAKAYKALQKVTEETDALQHVIQAAPKETAFAYRELSRIALDNRGEYDKAEEYIQKAIALDPKEPEYHYTQGAIYALRASSGGRLEKAMDAFQETLMLQPTHVDAAYQLGLLLQKAERWEEAASYFRAVISLSPTFGEPYLKLYQVYRKQGKTARAESLMRLYQDYRQASADRDMLTRRVRANPQDPTAAVTLATFYMRNGELASAERELQRIAGLRPNAPEPHQRLAELYAIQGRTQDEAEELKAAQQLRAQHSLARKGG
ncbi:MAG TPA: tetratricopeptide repeat protein [Chthonomonadaceae bacterium]|nr:tetratricopeptide repeat protein [Chthonomonadaceae bacterium]